MAGQGLIPAAPFPIFVNETDTLPRIVARPVYVIEDSVAGGGGPAPRRRQLAMVS